MLYKILHCAHLISRELSDANTRAYEVLNPAMDCIYANYKSGTISITHLARLCYISETYFRRLFRQAYGVSPIAFIRSLRIDTAASLLESGDFSVGDAAAAAGFTDTKYFSREFRRAKGVSPKNYFKR
jgi:AraC-like DNA-binding protein